MEKVIIEDQRELDRIMETDVHLAKYIKLTDDQLRKYIRKNTFLLTVLEDELSDDMKSIGVEQNPYAILHLKNPSIRLYKDALLTMPSVYSSIKNPPEEVTLYALSLEGSLLQYVKNPTEQMQIVAVKNRPFAIENIKNPSMEVMKTAIKGNVDCLKVLGDVPDELLEFALSCDDRAIRFIKNPDENMVINIIRKRPSLIYLIDKPSRRILEELAKIDSSQLAGVNHVTQDLIDVALKYQPDTLLGREDVPFEIKLKAFALLDNTNSSFIRYTSYEDVDFELFKKACDRNITCLSYINEIPSDVADKLYELYGLDFVRYTNVFEPHILVDALNKGFVDVEDYDDFISMNALLIDYIDELNEDSVLLIFEEFIDCIDDFTIKLLSDKKSIKKALMKIKLGGVN